MKRLKALAAILIMLTVAATVLWYGPGWWQQAFQATGEPGDPNADTVYPVTVASVRLAPRSSDHRAVGTARAAQAVSLYPESEGRVTKIHFRPGERVEAAQLLLELEQEREQLQVELARVRLAEAERELRRYRRIGDSGAVPAARLDAARTAAELAALELRTAQRALAERRLLAPFGGHIGLSDVDPGDRVDSDQLIATLDDRSRLLVDFTLPERYLGQLRPGDTVSLRPWAAEAPPGEARIVALDSRVDPQTRAFIVRAELDNRDDHWRPGMSFQVMLELQAGRYPLIPELALQWGGDGAFVWRAREGRAERVPVTIVQRGEGSLYVDGALRAGDLVITEGTGRMREGSALELLNAGQATR